MLTCNSQKNLILLGKQKKSDDPRSVEGKGDDGKRSKEGQVVCRYDIEFERRKF